VGWEHQVPEGRVHRPLGHWGLLPPLGIQSVAWGVNPNYPKVVSSTFGRTNSKLRGSLLGPACALASMDSHLYRLKRRRGDELEALSRGPLRPNKRWGWEKAYTIPLV